MPNANAHARHAADRRHAHLDAITARIGAHPHLDAHSATMLAEAADLTTLTDDEIREALAEINDL